MRPPTKCEKDRILEKFTTWTCNCGGCIWAVAEDKRLLFAGRVGPVFGYYLEEWRRAPREAADQV